jgi:hypothetical protein
MLEVGDVVAVAEDAGEDTVAVAAVVDEGRKEGRLVERHRYRKLLLEGK